MSELLTKPKPWHMLSIKGREPFIRMHLWLNDPNSVEKLHAVKGERDVLKRKRDSVSDLGSNPESPTAPEVVIDDRDSPNSKRSRMTLSPRQCEALKVAFAMEAYPSAGTLEFLSQELGLDAKTIVGWFHNHRMRLKQLQPHDVDSILGQRSTSEEPFDPLKFRILLNQRWLELCDEQGPPVSPQSNRSEGGGLDLSNHAAKVNHIEDEKDESVRQSFDLEESEAMVKVCGRSRRKPLAPQWLDPTGGAAIAPDDSVENNDPGEVNLVQNGEDGKTEAD